jgi:imidazolonepropionase-like amidohydrolase
MGVFAVLRQSLETARQYRDTPADRRLHDPVSAALAPVLEGTLPVVFEANSAQEIQRALRFAGEYGLKPVIYGGAEAWRVADLLRQRNVPVLVSLRLAPPERIGGSPFQPAAATELPPGSPERTDAESNPARLERAGVRFALVTGSVTKMEDNWAKLRTAISRGLSVAGALRALTESPAEILGIRHQFGALEPGQLANITITDGDLFARKPRIRAVVIGGTFHYPAPETPPSKPAPVSAAPTTTAAAQNAQRTQPTPQEQQPDPRQPLPDSAGLSGVSGPAIPARKPPLPEPPPANLVIRNATILTVTQGTIPNGSVWLSGGKIREVGKTLTAVPDNAKIIDGSGMFVMPGIVDSHSHTAVSGPVNEAGASVTAQVRIEDVLDAEDVSLYRAAAGGVTTLNVLHGSANVFGGQNAVIKARWGSPAERLLVEGAPRGIKMALGENPRRVNVPASLGSAGRYPATRMGIAEVVRESFSAAREYRRRWNQYRDRAAGGEKPLPPEKNLALEVLADVLDGKVLVHAHCYRADEIAMLLDMAEEFGFRIRTLQHVLEGYKVADRIRQHGAGASTFFMWGMKWEMFDGIPYNPAMLVRAGVRTAIHSDSDEIVRRLFHEAAKTMRYGGLTETEALRLITAEPAWMLGLEKRIGAIEPGMDGDLAIFSAHPFSPKARVEMTVVDGQIVFDRARDLKHRVGWHESWEAEPSGEAAGQEKEHIHE